MDFVLPRQSLIGLRCTILPWPAKPSDMHSNNDYSWGGGKGWGGGTYSYIRVMPN